MGSTAKQRILELLADGTMRTVRHIAAALLLPEPATRRNVNQLRAQNEVLLADQADVNYYYRVVVQ